MLRAVLAIFGALDLLSVVVVAQSSVRTPNSATGTGNRTGTTHSPAIVLITTDSNGLLHTVTKFATAPVVLSTDALGSVHKITPTIMLSTDQFGSVHTISSGVGPVLNSSGRVLTSSGHTIPTATTRSADSTNTGSPTQLHNSKGISESESTGNSATSTAKTTGASAFPSPAGVKTGLSSTTPTTTTRVGGSTTAPVKLPTSGVASTASGFAATESPPTRGVNATIGPSSVTLTSVATAPTSSTTSGPSELLATNTKFIPPAAGNTILTKSCVCPVVITITSGVGNPGAVATGPAVGATDLGGKAGTGVPQFHTSRATTPTLTTRAANMSLHKRASESFGSPGVHSSIVPGGNGESFGTPGVHPSIEPRTSPESGLPSRAGGSPPIGSAIGGGVAPSGFLNDGGPVCDCKTTVTMIMSPFNPSPPAGRGSSVNNSTDSVSAPGSILATPTTALPPRGPMTFPVTSTEPPLIFNPIQTQHVTQSILIVTQTKTVGAAIITQVVSTVVPIIFPFPRETATVTATVTDSGPAVPVVVPLWFQNIAAVPAVAGAAAIPPGIMLLPAVQQPVVGAFAHWASKKKSEEGGAALVGGLLGAAGGVAGGVAGGIAAGAGGGGGGCGFLAAVCNLVKSTVGGAFNVGKNVGTKALQNLSDSAVGQFIKQIKDIADKEKMTVDQFADILEKGKLPGEVEWKDPPKDDKDDKDKKTTKKSDKKTTAKTDHDKTTTKNDDKKTTDKTKSTTAASTKATSSSSHENSSTKASSAGTTSKTTVSHTTSSATSRPSTSSSPTDSTSHISSSRQSTSTGHTTTTEATTTATVCSLTSRPNGREIGTRTIPLRPTVTTFPKKSTTTGTGTRTVRSTKASSTARTTTSASVCSMISIPDGREIGTRTIPRRTRTATKSRGTSTSHASTSGISTSTATDVCSRITREPLVVGTRTLPSPTLTAFRRKTKTTGATTATGSGKSSATDKKTTVSTKTLTPVPSATGVTCSEDPFLRPDEANFLDAYIIELCRTQNKFITSKGAEEAFKGKNTPTVTQDSKELLALLSAKLDHGGADCKDPKGWKPSQKDCSDAFHMITNNCKTKRGKHTQNCWEYTIEAQAFFMGAPSNASTTVKTMTSRRESTTTAASQPTPRTLCDGSTNKVTDKGQNFEPAINILCKNQYDFVHSWWGLDLYGKLLEQGSEYGSKSNPNIPIHLEESNGSIKARLSVNLPKGSTCGKTDFPNYNNCLQMFHDIVSDCSSLRGRKTSQCWVYKISDDVSTTLHPPPTTTTKARLAPRYHARGHV